MKTIITYGKKTYRKLRKPIRKAISLLRQMQECHYLAKGSYLPGHRDNRFYKKNYLETNDSLPMTHKKGIICMCDGKLFHGGLTDRLRGILTTYREAKKRNIPFYIYWTSPFRLEEYLEPATVDWTIDTKDLSFDPRIAFPVIIEDETNFQSRMRMDAAFKIKLPQLHFYSNADNGIGEYRELYNELFRPTRMLEDEVSQRLEEIGAPYWAFTFRFLNLLGDFKEWNPKEMSASDARCLMEKTGSKMKEIMEALPEGYKVLVTSDSKRFLEYAKTLDDRIYVVPGDIKHIDLTRGEHNNAWLKTFVDQHLLMHAEKVCRMRTDRMYKSGFPRFAAEVGGKEFIDLSF